MPATKRAAKLSEVHLTDLERRLGRFADAFQMNIGGLSSAMLQAWLDISIQCAWKISGCRIEYTQNCDGIDFLQYK